MEYSVLWHTSNATSILKKEKGAFHPKNGNCLIESMYSLVSNGTEKLVAKGEVPKKAYKSMRVPYMEGDFSFPLTYGYSLVGQVIEGPEKLIGKNVHLMHPHQSFVKAAADDITIIPDIVPLKRATLASNLETIVNAIWDSNLQMGDRILVIGYGIIGALLCEVLRNFPGVDLVVVDKEKTKINEAANFGLDARIDMNSFSSDFDIAFNTSSNQEGLQTCIDYTGFEGTIVEMSWYGNRKVSLDLGTDFHHQRKKIISSQVGSIPANKVAHWDYKKRKSLVFKLLNNERFDQLITNEITFASTPDFFDQLRKNQILSIGTIINYNKNV